MAIRVSFREHRESNGEITLYARFKIPERKGGKVVYRNTERSTGTSQRVKARQRAEEIYQAAYEEAHKPQPGELADDTFAKAALDYMRHNGGKVTPTDGLIPAHRLKVRANKKYLHPIIEKAGLKKLREFDQALMVSLGAALYPDKSAATINRQLYTPVIAVLNFAKHPYQLQRPEGHDSLPELDIPADSWYPGVLREANPYARAFLITQRMTGRRPDELLNRTPDHYINETGVLQVWDGKAEQFISLELPEPARIALDALPNLRNDPERGGVGKGARRTFAKRNFLFGTNHKSTMIKWIKDACKEAGVRYHMPKEAGRHAFVTKNLQEGKSLKWVQDAGRWKTLKVVAEKYGHLEKQEVDRQAREAGEEWFRQVLSQPVQIEGNEQRILGIEVGKGKKDQKNQAG